MNSLLPAVGTAAASIAKEVNWKQLAEDAWDWIKGLFSNKHKNNRKKKN